MTPGTRFYLARALPRRAALGVAGFRHGRPGHAAPLVQRDGEPLVGVERAPVRSFLRPGHVVGARPVTRLARHVEFRPGRLVDAGRGVEVLAEVGRMALGARKVPVLATRCPMQPIAGTDVLPRVEVKPALAALVFRARVPGNGQRLHAPSRQFDQVLLQRTHAECVLDLVVVELAVRTIGIDEVPAVTTRERRCRSGILELAVGEVAEHGLVVGDLHGQVVIRPAPRRQFPGVAFAARASPHIACAGNRRRLHGAAASAE